MERKSIKWKSKNMSKRPLRVLLTLLFAFVMMLLVGCKPTLVEFKHICGDGIELTEIKQNDSIISIINDYIKRHPKYNTFVLSRPILLSWDDSIVLKGLILGPGYRPLYGRREKLDTLWLHGKCVICFDSISDRDLYYKEGFVEYKKKYKNVQDIYIQSNGYVVDGELYNYIFRSIYIDRKDDKLIVNTRPDTLFLPIFEKSNNRFTCPNPSFVP